MFRRRGSESGFALVELMVVVLIISVLATLSIPALQRLKTRTKAAAVVNDFRVFATAFETYAHETGGWPAETAAGVLPAVMAGRLTESAWTRITPMGGRYNWENNQMHIGTRYAAAITISPGGGSTVPLDANLLMAIDSGFDDGNLLGGNIRLGSALAPLYVIQR